VGRADEKWVGEIPIKECRAWEQKNWMPWSENWPPSERVKSKVTSGETHLPDLTQIQLNRAKPVQNVTLSDHTTAEAAVGNYYD